MSKRISAFQIILSNFIFDRRVQNKWNELALNEQCCNRKLKNSSKSSKIYKLINSVAYIVYMLHHMA